MACLVGFVAWSLSLFLLVLFLLVVVLSVALPVFGPLAGGLFPAACLFGGASILTRLLEGVLGLVWLFVAWVCSLSFLFLEALASAASCCLCQIENMSFNSLGVVGSLSAFLLMIASAAAFFSAESSLSSSAVVCSIAVFLRVFSFTFM